MGESNPLAVEFRREWNNKARQACEELFPGRLVTDLAAEDYEAVCERAGQLMKVGGDG